LEPGIAAYCERIMALEEMQEWVAAARQTVTTAPAAVVTPRLLLRFRA
jgi:hypothetical protein